MQLAWQGSLLTVGTPEPESAFRSLQRVVLGAIDDAWVDHAPGWLAGADELMAALVRELPWQGRVVPMYERMVDQPRLTASLNEPPRQHVVEQMRTLLSERYEIELTGIGANLYRDGHDSVAWHGDRVARDLPEAVVAIVSLGGRRRFLLRPHGGGKSVRFNLASGDLLVMGGSCQRTWEHAIPKSAKAIGPRISIQFRRNSVW